LSNKIAGRVLLAQPFLNEFLPLELLAGRINSPSDSLSLKKKKKKNLKFEWGENLTTRPASGATHPATAQHLMLSAGSWVKPVF